MRKINHNLAPDYLTKIFTSTRSNGFTYTTRQSQNYSIPKCRLKFYIYLNHLTVVPTAIDLWNGIYTFKNKKLANIKIF